MKNWLNILILLPFFGLAQVNFSTYGAAGDGVADDTAEIQAALDAEDNLIADEGAVFRISSRIDIDTQSGQTIDWNGSTITTNSTLSLMVLCNKRTSDGGTTTMTDLIIDGNDLAVRGILVQSRPNFTNVDVINTRQSSGTASAVGIQIEIFNDGDVYGDWIFDGCDVDDTSTSQNDNQIGNVPGIANNLWFRVNQIPSSPTTVTFKNAAVTDGYGEDGQNLFVDSPNLDTSFSNIQFNFEDVDFSGWERRSLKLFAGNLYFLRGSAANDLNSNATGSLSPAGMIAMGASSLSDGAANIVFEDFDFIGRTSGGRSNQIIIQSCEGASINNSALTLGADLHFTYTSLYPYPNDNIFVCSTSFGAGSAITESGAVQYAAADAVSLDTGNTYTDGSGAIQIDEDFYVETALECPAVGDIDVTGVTVSPSSAEIEDDETIQLTRVMIPSNATDQTGAWDSSSEAAATVDSNGLVTGVAAGSTTITYTTNDGSFTDTSAITVVTATADDSIESVDPVIYLTPTSIDPAVTTDGNPISTWNDISGNNLHATPSGTVDLNVSSTRQVEFDGASWLEFPLSSLNNFTPGTDPFTLIFREGDAVSTGTGYGISKAGSDGSRQYGITYTGGELSAYYVGGVSGSLTSIPAGPNRLVIAVVSTTDINVWVDGDQVVTGGSIGTGVSVGAQMNVGGRSNGSYLVTSGSQFDLIAVIPSAIDSGERAAIESEFQINGASDNDPVITLLGSTPVNITTDDDYTDAGATATDVEDGDLTGSIVVGGDTVDDDTPGTYVITYNVDDSDENAATEVTRTVNVSAVNASITPGVGPNGEAYYIQDGTNRYYPN